MEKIIKNNEFIIAVLISILVLILTMYIIPPQHYGDTESYIESIEVLSGNILPDEDFQPNRILTTFGGMQTIRFLTPVFSNQDAAWVFLNSIFFIFSGFIFYLILRNLFSVAVSMFGTVVMLTNYGFVSFGAHMLMDIGGWFAYLLSTYLAIKFYKEKNIKFLYLAALTVGLGVLFKEHAILGTISIALVIIKRYLFGSGEVFGFFKNVVGTIAVSLTPLALVMYHVFTRYNYTYLDWLSSNSEKYGTTFAESVVTYIKTFGSLYTFGWIVFLLGTIILFGLVKKNKISFEKKFIVAIITVSALPVFVWPAITQRVLAVLVPALVVMSCFFFEYLYRKNNKHVFFVVIFVFASLYVPANYLMDLYILDNFSIGSFIPFLR